MQETVLTSDPIWQALADCEIKLTMVKLLRLVPQFWQAVENQMQGIDKLEISANFTEFSTSPALGDHHNPTIKVVLQGQEITGCIVEGDSRVNVINKATCNRLSFTEWEAWPF